MAFLRSACGEHFTSIFTNMKKTNVEIVEYNDQLKDCIKRLNYEWLQKFFRIESGDEISLSNPKEQIIANGGLIYYAKVNDTIVGTAALLKKSEGVYELGKMAVTEKYQGLGIGRQLLEHCLAVASQKNFSKLILYSNTRLASAIHLYRSYGFKETDLEEGLYERANIKMEKELKTELAAGF